MAPVECAMYRGQGLAPCGTSAGGHTPTSPREVGGPSHPHWDRVLPEPSRGSESRSHRQKASKSRPLELNPSNGTTQAPWRGQRRSSNSPTRIRTTAETLYQRLDARPGGRNDCLCTRRLVGSKPGGEAMGAGAGRVPRDGVNPQPGGAEMRGIGGPEPRPDTNAALKRDATDAATDYRKPGRSGRR